MTATPTLTTDLQRQVLRLEDDLRARVDGDASVKGRWVSEHQRALKNGRTAAAWAPWRDGWITQAAVAWVLTTVFVRFCEDNNLLRPVWIAGPERRRQEALDAQLAFFRQHPEDTDREWIEQAIGHLGSFPATAALVDKHSALNLVSPSGKAASELLAFWRRRGDDGTLIHDLTDSTLSTRFLGDMYQDLSEYAKKTFALLQTPEFVEEFILDRTFEPALAERRLEGFRMIDPACGSGHFLLGGFARLLDRWNRHAPGLELQARVQEALDAIHGVDLNPFAVAISRFRLTVSALKACGLKSLERAPAFRFHVAVGDSLLHGPGASAHGADTDPSGFTYATEDRALLDEILAAGRYDVVVGNPPYITVKDRQLNQAYRDRYSTCSGKYAMTVPFMERYFELASPARDGKPAGWTGQITSNSFMKREFGAKIIEGFLVHKDLRLIVDTSGAYIPGHGTPTVILIGRNQRAMEQTVRAVLGVRGEPGRPEVAAKGIVWRAIVEHIDESGWDDGWITIADLDRSLLSRHPWSLSGGGAVDLLAEIEAVSSARLQSCTASIGITCFTLEDDVYVAHISAFITHAIDSSSVREMVLGDGIRDWRSYGQPSAIFPYDDSFQPVDVDTVIPVLRWMWPYRTNLSNNLLFGGQTKIQGGLQWTEYGRLTYGKLRTSLSIAFAEVATHNHFVLDRGGKVFKQTAPVIKLPEGATEDEHLALLGVLNSSTAGFWLKQKSHKKAGALHGGGSSGQSWTHIYQFAGTTLREYPLPPDLPSAFGRRLDLLAQRGAQLTPAAVVAEATPTAERLNRASGASAHVRAQMIAVQEELDWAVYELYGLTTNEMTYRATELPDLVLGERAFEIALAREAEAGSVETTWFSHKEQRSTSITSPPAQWSPGYRELVQRRLDLIASDPAIRLLEKPDYKRRWAAETWEKQQTAALRDWLLDRLEDRRFWFDPQGRPSPRSVAQLADEVARDPDLLSVLALWEGRPDVPVTQSLVKLLADEAVPYLAAFRYQDSGLRKREVWEETWVLQRREDAGEDVGTIPVPPKYASEDFRETPYWRARGKLDVPKERFVLYPDAGRETDSTPLLGWAGWDLSPASLGEERVRARRR